MVLPQAIDVLMGAERGQPRQKGAEMALKASASSTGVSYGHSRIVANGSTCGVLHELVGEEFSIQPVLVESPRRGGS